MSLKCRSHAQIAARTAAARVGEGEFVVAGGQPAPVLDDVERSFDDVAALVFLGVEADRAPASAAAASAVIDLGGLFGDDRADAPGAADVPGVRAPSRPYRPAPLPVECAARPRIPFERGNNGSMTFHCASVKTASRGTPNTLTDHRPHIKETRPSQNDDGQDSSKTISSL